MSIARSVALGTLLLALACSREPAVELPEVRDWTGEPQVAEKIARVRAAALENRSADSIGRLGQVFHAHDLHAEAVACYRQVAARDTEEPRWPYLEALALAKSDLEASAPLFERALTLGIEQPAAHVNYADVLSRLGRFDEAETQYRRALALEPVTTHAHYGLAQIALERGAVDAAVELLEQAIEAAPWHGEVRVLLARALQRQGRPEAAERELVRAGVYPNPSRTPDPILAEVEAEAVSSLVYRLQGQRLADRGRFAEAEELFRTVLEITSDKVRDYANLGGALTGQGRFDEAFEEFDKALALDPEDSLLRNNIGMAHAGAGDLEKAVESFEQAISIDPGYAEAHRNLGLVRARQGRAEDAMTHYRQALDHNPSLVEARNDLGTALAARGDFDGAVAEWRAALDIDPRAMSALYNLSVVLVDRGEHEEAVQWLRRGVQIAPNSSRVLSLLAWELATAPDSELRNGAEAVQMAERVFAAYPAQPQAADTLAAALAETGDFDRAAQLATRALAGARAAGQVQLVGQIQARLQGYRRGEPFRQRL